MYMAELAKLNVFSDQL